MTILDRTTARKARFSFCHLAVVAWLIATGGANAGEAIVVCHESLRPAMGRWIDDRANRGIDVTLVSPGRSPEAVREAIRSAADDQTRFLLIVGEVPDIGAPVIDAPGIEASTTRATVPSFYQPTTVTRQFGSTPTLITDRPYGDLDGDGRIDMAVGRWPVSTPAQVTAAIDKVIESERCQDFGDWRGRVELVGGIGGFGPMIDMAIESVTRSVVTASLPRSVRTGVLYASPGHHFFPNQIPFRDAVVHRYNRGCRFWVYAGHGQITELDRVQDAPILDGSATESLTCDDRRHAIALLLACYTAAMDAPADDIASSLWRSPGGPVAVIAGTRVTMPYGNCQLALSLIDGIYDRSQRTLGEAWLHAQQRLESSEPATSATGKLIDSLATVMSPQGSDLQSEKREHAALYQLIGDPTMRLHPPHPIALKIPSSVATDETWKVSWVSPIDGLARLSIDRALGTPSAGNPNDLTVFETTESVRAGQQVTLTVAAGSALPGPSDVRVHIAGEQAWAVGGGRVLVRPAD